MIQYIFKTAIRHLLHRKHFTLLNILGFTLAFSTAVLIFSYVLHEYSFDRYHEKAEQLFRVEINNQVIMPGMTGQLLQANVPSIKKQCTICLWGGYALSNSNEKNNIVVLNHIANADSSLGDLFSIHVLAGDLKQTLTDVNRIAINQSSAEKMFGSIDVIGKDVWVGFNYPLTIGAVFEDFPANSNLQNSGFTSLKRNEQRHDKNTNSFILYLELEHPHQKSEMEEKIQQVLTEKLKYTDAKVKLRSIKDIHFSENVKYEYAKVTKHSTVYLFLSIGILILIISLINFYNFKCGLLPTREKGFFVQRVNGASPTFTKLVLFAESLIICTTAGLFSLICVELFINSSLVRLIPMDFSTVSLAQKSTLLLLISILSAVIAAVMPTGFSPKRSLLSHYQKPFSRSFVSMRTALITIQFLASLILIICTFVIYQQKQYLLEYDTGMKSQNIISVQLNTKIVNQRESFTSQLKSLSQITDVTYAAHGPSNSMDSRGQTIDGKAVNFFLWPVHYNFLNFFGINVTKGRHFSSNYTMDKNNLIFNQTAINNFNWEQKLNKKIKAIYPYESEIIGICNDFHYASLHHDIQPICFWLSDKRTNMVFVKYTGSIAPVVKHIQKLFNQYTPELPFDYNFMDDTYAQYYKSVIRLFNLITFFSFIALIITGFGIIGLVTIITQRHIKEIGIRKANGAQTSEIILYLNKKITITILIAFLISIPLVWYLMELWLRNFTQHTPLHWYYFSIGGLCVWTLATLITLRQTWKAASQNPVKCLRYE